jgi:hypothetical protein
LKYFQILTKININKKETKQKKKQKGTENKKEKGKEKKKEKKERETENKKKRRTGPTRPAHTARGGCPARGNGRPGRCIGIARNRLLVFKGRAIRWGGGP